MNTYTFHVSGTHCKSCKILIEDVLGEEESVRKVHVDLKKEMVEIETDSDEDIETLAPILSRMIEPNGYTLSVEKTIEQNEQTDDIWKAIPIGLGLLAVFFILQKSGVLELGLGGQTTPVTSLLIGLVASVSSCLAVVGGLVLSLSAKISQDTVSDTRTFTFFHVGRLVTFAVLGGVLGAVGGIIGINFTLAALLGIIASLVMLFLGLNLVGVMSVQTVFPTGLFQFLRKIEHKTFTPLILGFATFFLPCGFTQAMQIAALSSGSFVSGALIMFAFALGTLPMLLLLSFGSASFAHSKYATLFFKSTGVVVIGLGLFALLAGLASLGLIPPLLNI